MFYLVLKCKKNILAPKKLQNLRDLQKFKAMSNEKNWKRARQKSISKVLTSNNKLYL
jgi:hypothetical protein